MTTKRVFRTRDFVEMVENAWHFWQKTFVTRACAHDPTKPTVGRNRQQIAISKIKTVSIVYDSRERLYAKNLHYQRYEILPRNAFTKVLHVVGPFCGNIDFFYNVQAHSRVCLIFDGKIVPIHSPNQPTPFLFAAFKLRNHFTDIYSVRKVVTEKFKLLCENRATEREVVLECM